MKTNITNDIILTRQLSIDTWRVRATIAKAKERMEMMPFLMRLNEVQRATAKDIAQHLLFEGHGRKIVAERLLDIAKSYGLVNEEKRCFEIKYFWLTENGKKAIRSKQIFVPEEGCWEFSISNDPLLPHPVVDIQSFIEPSAKSEIIGEDVKKILQNRIKNFQKLPSWCDSLINMELSTHINGENIKINEINDEAEKVPMSDIKSKYRLILEWNVSKRFVRLLNAQGVVNQFDGPKSTTTDNVWKMLLENKELLQNWNEAKNSLAVNFEDVNDFSKNTMMMDIKFHNTKINKFDTFDVFIAQNVCIHAASQDDAQKWVEWRLENSICTFATNKNYKEWCSKSEEPFNEFHILLPTRNQLAQKIWQNNRNRKSWHLMAAADWGL